MRHPAHLLLLVALLASVLQTPGAAQEELKKEDVSLAVTDGIAYLLDEQNEDGSWGGPVNQTFTSGFANPATYRMWQIGTTGLSARTLLERGSTEEHEEGQDKGSRA